MTKRARNGRLNEESCYQSGCLRQASGLGTAARLTRPITSDNFVLCKPRGLISLDFFVTALTPPKTPENCALLARQLAL